MLSYFLHILKQANSQENKVLSKVEKITSNFQEPVVIT